MLDMATDENFDLLPFIRLAAGCRTATTTEDNPVEGYRLLEMFQEREIRDELRLGGDS